MSYFSEIKHKDIATRQRFVVVATVISFFLIVGAWVPIRIAQWKTPGDAVVAKSEATAEPEATTTPVVAGDSAFRMLTNTATPKPTVAPVLVTQPEITSTPEATTEPLFETEAPNPTDFPTL